jgi:hypothetical protein
VTGYSNAGANDVKGRRIAARRRFFLHVKLLPREVSIARKNYGKAAPFRSTSSRDDIDLARDVGISLAEAHEGLDHLGRPRVLDLRVRQGLQPGAAEDLDLEPGSGESFAIRLGIEHAPVPVHAVGLAHRPLVGQ